MQGLFAKYGRFSVIWNPEKRSGNFFLCSFFNGLERRREFDREIEWNPLSRRWQRTQTHLQHAASAACLGK